MKDHWHDKARERAYRVRVRQLRQILLPGATQGEFEKRLGLRPRLWSNYERGYPLPRETAFILEREFGAEFSPEWLWWGRRGNLTKAFAQALESFATLAAEQAAIDHARVELQRRQAALDAKRKRKSPPRGRAFGRERAV